MGMGMGVGMGTGMGTGMACEEKKQRVNSGSQFKHVAYLSR